MHLAQGIGVMLRRGLFILGSLAALVMACKQENAVKPERLCTPEAYVFCRCSDRSEGTKRCKEDGASFDECLPCDGSGASAVGSGGTDGLGSGHGTDEARTGSGEGDEIGSGGTARESDGGRAPDDDDAGSTAPPPSSTDSGARRDSGTGSTGTGTGTTGGRDAGSTTGGGSVPSAAHCKKLENIAPRVELQRIADEPTPAAGGKPANGVYVQSWVVEFTGEDGETGPSKHYSRETIELSGDVGRYVFEDDDGTSAAGGFRLTVNGSKVEVAYECPAAPPKELKYDATSSTLILYDPPYARVFTKQRSR
jgi:hypothetical protein